MLASKQLKAEKTGSRDRQLACRLWADAKASWVDAGRSSVDDATDGEAETEEEVAWSLFF